MMALGGLDLVQHYQLGLLAALALSLARVLPLAMARRRPLVAFAASLIAVVVVALAAQPVSPAEGWPWPVTSLLTHVTVTVVAASALSRRRVLVGLWLASSLAGVAVMAVFPDRGDWPGVLPGAIFIGVGLVAGDAMRDRAVARHDLKVHVRLNEEERARRGLLEERARIARELHDIVAHHMSVITVQAESAAYRLPGLPAAAVDEFADIAAGARASLDEMRRLLVVLRSDSAGGGDRRPQPGLAQLGDLVAGARRAGGAVELESKPSLPWPGVVPAAIELAVYRVVQEALSNVVRHATGAATRVSVGHSDHEVRATVTNTTPPGGAAAQPDGRCPGQGMVGMRERVAMLGGSFEAGPLPGGGFRVTARIPLGHDENQREDKER